MRGLLYRAIMRLAHRFNWHYAPPIYPEGDTQLWCKWCGFRQVIKTHGNEEGEMSVSETGLLWLEHLDFGLGHETDTKDAHAAAEEIRTLRADLNMFQRK